MAVNEGDILVIYFLFWIIFKLSLESDTEWKPDQLKRQKESQDRITKASEYVENK